MRFLSFAVLFSLATPATAESPRVAVDIAPVHGLVARVMQGVGVPETIVPPSGSAHSHDLRPSAASALEQADIVVRIGDELTPWLARPIETLAGDAVVITLLQAAGTHTLSFRHDEDFGSTKEDDHDHDEGAVDPHAWLDPDNASLWMDRIAEALAAVDPENAATYRENAEDGAREVAEVANTIEARLLEIGPIRYAVAHDAYQYFEHRFGLEPVAAVSLGDAASPGPARLLRVREMLAEAKATCLLIEPGTNNRVPRMLADASDIGVVEADPMGAMLPDGPDQYTRLLLALSESFAACP